MFDNEVEQLSNEYTLRIIKKGYVLDNVWEKCEQYHRKIIDSWHDKGFKEKELWRSGDEKTNYEPPFVDVKTFEVKKYSFKGEQSFICITKQDDDTFPLRRVNATRFKAMIRKELNDKGIAHDEM
nr:RNA-directed DNA polymerase, eukaryota, reverse transcriptase zinc-binding domain protein [Tanacetum cinerariifolium]